MTISREARVAAGITLLAVPTIQYGGLTLLALVTGGGAGVGGEGLVLDETQRALWRAGHAHAGVWVILSLVMQLLLDGTDLSKGVRRLARLSAPASAVVISAGFFGLAFLPAFRWMVYLGGALLFIALGITGAGLLINARTRE
ncbi:hypothetical protein H0Z60_20255 [Ectothiorhodospiraceae bacterium WFHF3C12]|nr:hypothetical protein [Ectothiorhodospiraceae bacterium WFHF3C12]